MNKTEVIAETRKFIHDMANLLMISLGHLDVLSMSTEDDNAKHKLEKIRSSLQKQVDLLTKHREVLIKEQDSKP